MDPGAITACSSFMHGAENSMTEILKRILGAQPDQVPLLHNEVLFSSQFVLVKERKFNQITTSNKSINSRSAKYPTILTENSKPKTQNEGHRSYYKYSLIKKTDQRTTQ
jgi:hypothetical protein